MNAPATPTASMAPAAALPEPHGKLPRNGSVPAPAPANFGIGIERAVVLQRKGYPERALIAFEQALALKPGDVEALAASAQLLAELKRPRAAWNLLSAHRDTLTASAGGCVNLAQAASGVGRDTEAQELYARALELAPDNVQALTQMAAADLQAADYESAIRRTRRCVELRPDMPDMQSNLIDCLIAARRHAEALELLEKALARFPGDHAFIARRALMLAYVGDFAGAAKAMAALPQQATHFLRELLAGASPAVANALRAGLGVIPSPPELFTQQAFDAINQCDWRAEDTVVSVLRQLLALAKRTGGEPDWRTAQFYTLLLPMTETEQLEIRDVTASTVRKRVARLEIPQSGKPPPRADKRIHVGISVTPLTEARAADALREELRLHDHERFAFHLYSPVATVGNAAAESFRDVADSVVEIGHMSPTEAVMRMRLDRLDLWMDLTYFTPWCRLEPPALRVAPVQIRRQVWQRTQRQPADYVMGDRVTHPGARIDPAWGNIARLPFTCWLATDPESSAGAPVTRAQAGIADEAFVLCAFVPAPTIDPHSFSTWMGILRALPAAVLLLPNLDAATRANLAREAQGAGVAPGRLVFAPKLVRHEMLQWLRLADLFLDPLRFSASHVLTDVLRAGVPALTCAGGNMASRLGASIVTAAGLPDCVLPDAQSLRQKAVMLGNDPRALAALRARLGAAFDTAPLFDPRARVREWEAAWSTMVERHARGLRPEAFDVAPAAPTPAA